jgi:N-acetylmuramoyl-L-alanine amidase
MAYRHSALKPNAHGAFLIAIMCLLVCLPSALLAKSRRDKKAKSQSEFIAREAQPSSTGDRSLTRALDLKIGRIVIDPGHGGADTGTVGVNGLQEKDLVLDVSQRLGKILQRRMGADVIYTRDSDKFIPLESRTEIANHENADLFVSIHGNHSEDPQTRGVETYYLSFTAATDALQVASRENAASEMSVGKLQDLVKQIAMNEKVGESREFAANVQRALYAGVSNGNLAIRDRGVKKAPFIVLIGAHMPSILAEISFLSNSVDEQNLKKSEYRDQIAESLYRGIAKYVNGLSGVRPAGAVATTAAVGIHLPQLPPPPPVQAAPPTPTPAAPEQPAASPWPAPIARTPAAAKNSAATSSTGSPEPTPPVDFRAAFFGFVAHRRTLIVMILLLGAAWSIAHDYNEPARRFARRHLAARTQ